MRRLRGNHAHYPLTEQNNPESEHTCATSFNPTHREALINIGENVHIHLHHKYLLSAQTDAAIPKLLLRTSEGSLETTRQMFNYLLNLCSCSALKSVVPGLLVWLTVLSGFKQSR